MAAFVIETGAVFLNQYKLTGITKAVYDVECNMLEKTSYDSSGAREFAPGLMQGKISIEGYMDESVTNELLTVGLNTVNVCTIFPFGLSYPSAAGTTGTLLDYCAKMDNTKITREATVGELYKYNIEGALDSLAIKGVFNFPFSILTTGSRSATYDMTEYLNDGYTRAAVGVNNIYINSSGGKYTAQVIASCSSNFTTFGSIVNATEDYTVGSYTLGVLSTDRQWVRAICWSSDSQTHTIISFGVTK